MRNPLRTRQRKTGERPESQARTKKARRPCGCGLNPIQGELEETGVTISQCNIEVFFIVVITDI
jgi:hypothetical protein